MRVPILFTLLFLVAAVSVADAGLIKLIVRLIMIGVKAGSKAVVGGGTATAVSTAVLSAADLALNIANVISGGCMYEKEICTLTPEIENLEKQMVQMYNTLTTLDQKNNKFYNDLALAFDTQNSIAQLADRVQFLVISIIQKIGQPATLDKLGQEFESNTNRMVNAFKANMQQYKYALKAKAASSGMSDVSVLLYYGSKAAYKNLKNAGKISSPKHLKTVKFPTSGLSKLAKPKLFTKVATSLTTVKSFFKKPSIVKFASKAGAGGMVLGSLVGLGLTLGVDISQARKMRDSLRKTRDEMKQMKDQINREIARERATEKDLNTAFNDLKKEYIKLINIINPSLKKKLSTNVGSTPKDLYNNMLLAKATFRVIVQDLEKVDANFSVIKAVRVGVDMGDDVSRIISTIKKAGLGSFTKSDILIIIAEEYPKKSSYKEYKLSKYRSF